MNLLFDPIKLEKLLIKHWTEFIEPKEIINLARSTAERQLGYSPPNIQNLKITRFELVNSNFVIWIDFIIKNQNSNVNTTIEILCDFKGVIKNIELNNF